MTAARRPEAKRSALLVTTSTYEDGALAGLVSPAQDGVALAEVLASPSIGDFTVTRVEDADASGICRAIEDFAAERDRADLMVLYLSCHGLKDDQGRLYFAARDTRRDRLRSTSVPAGFVNDILFACPSRRKVLLLDCCYSGAFAKGLAVKADPAVHTRDQFDARGLVVLTASDATQYAFEGDRVKGRAEPSRFTSCLVEGLRTGAADLDGDGLVSVDDVYEFTRRRLAEEPRVQSPRKWEFDVAGSIVLARSPSTQPAARPAPWPAVVPVVADTPAPAPHRVRQWSWWLAVVLFAATTVAACLVLAYWVDELLHPLVVYEYLPGVMTSLRSASIAGLVWAVVYAVADLDRAGNARWYDLYLRWLDVWRDVFRPPGPGAFVRALVIAIPLNVTVTVLVSLGAAAVGYGLAGSEARDQAYRLTFILMTAVAVVFELAGRRPARSPKTDPPA